MAHLSPRQAEALLFAANRLHGTLWRAHYHRDILNGSRHILQLIDPSTPPRLREKVSHLLELEQQLEVRRRVKEKMDRDCVDRIEEAMRAVQEEEEKPSSDLEKV